MQVSKEFYQVAGPLLYSDVIIKGEHSMSKVLVGHDNVDHEATRYRREVVNTKSEWLNMVRQITLFHHTCKRSSFHNTTLPNLQTLIIYPPAASDKDQWVCGNRSRCPILAQTRPRKVVIHNSGNFWDPPHRLSWPLCVRPFEITSATLTLVLDGTMPAWTDHYHWYAPPCWSGLRKDILEEIRVIVPCKTLAWLDRVADREGKNRAFADLKDSLRQLLARLMVGFRVPFRIYIFHTLCEGFMNESELAINLVLDGYRSDMRPTYSIGSLSDYIA